MYRLSSLTHDGMEEMCLQARKFAPAFCRQKMLQGLTQFWFHYWFIAVTRSVV